MYLCFVRCLTVGSNSRRWLRSHILKFLDNSPASLGRPLFVVLKQLVGVLLEGMRFVGGWFTAGGMLVCGGLVCYWEACWCVGDWFVAGWSLIFAG